MRFRNAIGFESLDIISQEEEEKRVVGCIYGLHLLAVKNCVTLQKLLAFIKIP